MQLVFDVDRVKEPAVHVIVYVPQRGHAEVYGRGGLFVVGDDGGDGIIVVINGG